MADKLKKTEKPADFAGGPTSDVQKAKQDKPASNAGPQVALKHTETKEEGAKSSSTSTSSVPAVALKHAETKEEGAKATATSTAPSVALKPTPKDGKTAPQQSKPEFANVTLKKTGTDPK